jgi:hypothetical protein
MLGRSTTPPYLHSKVMTHKKGLSTNVSQLHSFLLQLLQTMVPAATSAASIVQCSDIDYNSTRPH